MTARVDQNKKFCQEGYHQVAPPPGLKMSALPLWDEKKLAEVKKDIGELFDAFDQIANGTLDVR